MKRARFMAVILAYMVLAGCQQTPDQNIVSRKDLQQMLDMAASPTEAHGSLADKMGVPERYEASFQDAAGNVKVTVDAQIIMPDADAVPIVRVKPKAFRQEVADKLIRGLFDEGTLYTPDSLIQLSKTDIVQLLTQLKKRKSELEAQGSKPSTQDKKTAKSGQSGGAVAEEGTANQLDVVIASIEYYEDLLVSVPDEKEPAEAVTALNPDAGAYFVQAGQKKPGGGISTLTIIGDNGTTHRVTYVNRGDNDTSSGQYQIESEYNQNEDKDGRAKADALSYPQITEQQARETADQFLVSIGINDLHCTTIEKVIGGSGTYLGGDIRIGNIIKAYRLQYIRTVNGVPLTYTNVRGAWNDTDSSAIWAWDYERMTFIINDDGIVELEWNAPYEIMDTVVQSAALLPFSKIREVCEMMIVVNNAYKTNVSTELKITRLQLGLARITEQDDMNTGLLIPVWDVFGTATYHFENGGIEVYTMDDPGESFLTINAIDGSVIDRQLGY